MAEFGEQLRKVREEKGMTQQSLAEKIYVTRQTVSRWEGGERYPDLITIKKIAQVLEVDVGFLFSDDDTQHIVERNQVIEKSAVNNVTLILFTGIIISYLISVMGVIVKLLPSLTLDVNTWITGRNITEKLMGDIKLIADIIGKLLEITAFTAGFVWILKNSFSPKKVGAVMMAFYVSIIIEELAFFTVGASIENRMIVCMNILFHMLAFVSTYESFWRKPSSKLWYWVIIITSVLEIIRAIYTVGITVIYAERYISTETALNAVLSICIHMLFCYQIYVLNIRRKMANDILDNKT